MGDTEPWGFPSPKKKPIAVDHRQIIVVNSPDANICFRRNDGKNRNVRLATATLYSCLRSHRPRNFYACSNHPLLVCVKYSPQFLCLSTRTTFYTFRYATSMQLALPHSAGATEKKKKRSKIQKEQKKKRSLPHLRLRFRFRKCLDRLRFTDTVALETDAQVHRHCLVRLGSSTFSARPPSVLFFFLLKI